VKLDKRHIVIICFTITYLLTVFNS